MSVVEVWASVISSSRFRFYVQDAWGGFKEDIRILIPGVPRVFLMQRVKQLFVSVHRIQYVVQ